jgi:hypothetical protein
MTTITFDSEQLVTELEASGVPLAQARGIVRGIIKAQERLVTSEYFDARLHQELAPIKQDLAVVKTELTMQRWMLGFLMAGMLSLMLKAFL